MADPFAEFQTPAGDPFAAFQSPIAAPQGKQKPAARPGFWESLGNTVNPLNSIPGLIQQSKPGGIQLADITDTITPEERKRHGESLKARRSLQSKVLSTAPIGPPAEEDIVPGWGELMGREVGGVVNAALLTMIGEGMESPRLRGYVSGAVKKGLPKIAAHHGIAQTALKAIPDVIQGSQEGARGKLWSGPVARGLRDDLLPLPPPVIEGAKAAGAVRGQYDAVIPTPPPVETGGGHIPDYVHPLPGPEEMARRIAAKRVSVAATPTKLLDDIAVGQAGKKFAKLDATGQAAVRDIASRIPPGPVAVPPLASTAEQSIGTPVITPAPGTGPIASMAKNGEWIVPASERPTGWENFGLKEPVITPAPGTGPGSKGWLESHVEGHRHTKAEDVARAGASNQLRTTDAKDFNIAQHLRAEGVTPEHWAGLSKEQKNEWITRVNKATGKSHKPFGSDAGRGWGRTAEDAAAHVGEVLRGLWE